MNALTMPVRPKQDASLRPLPWRRMAWVTWRQHRFALAGLVALLSALGLVLWVVGLQLHDAYGAAAACRPTSSSVCAGLANAFSNRDRLLNDGYLLQVVPALVGAFVGAPVLARELESGTFRYAWTQGLGRSRWTVAKIVALALVVTVAAAAFSLLLSWYYRPYFANGVGNLSFFEMSPLAGGVFDLRAIALPAWTLVAFSISCLAGVLLRRVVPAIIVTLAAYAGLALAAGLFLRQRYMTPLVTRHLQLVEGPKVTPLGTNWILSQTFTKAGQSVGRSAVERFLHSAPTGDSEKGFDPTQYLLQHGYTVLTHYQPASRFWPFQWIEGGWLLALSLLLIAVTIWLVHRQGGSKGRDHPGPGPNGLRTARPGQLTEPIRPT